MIILGVDYADFDGDIECAVLCESRNGVIHVLRYFCGSDEAARAERLAQALNVRVVKEGEFWPTIKDE